MLNDILEETQPFPNRLVVTDDPEVEEVARRFGCSLVGDPGTGLNDALEAGTESAMEAGAASLLVLPSDVPLVQMEDISALFSYSEPVVIAASPDGGTNGLLRRPPDAVDTRYGPLSAEEHRQSAEKAGLEWRIVALTSLTLDVDGPDDLARLAASSVERDSVAVARALLEDARSAQPSP